MSGPPGRTPKTRIIPIQIEKSSEEIIAKENTSSEEVEVGSSSDTSSQEINSNYAALDLKRTLPLYNVKEKIVIVFDPAEDEQVTPFEIQNNQTKPLEILKRAVETFIRSKQGINKKHEFALAILNENTVHWLVDFTSNVNEIIHALQSVKTCETEDILELKTLFDLILQHVDVPELCEKENAILPPAYIVRAILLYNRSITMPHLNLNPEIDGLLKSPFFICDVLMTHEPVDVNNNCNRIFNVLQNLDKKGLAYFFPVARDLRTLHVSMAKLLGHPLQRPLQKLAHYSIKPQ